MAVPGDATTVLKAVRLGWCMSEVRGRNRPGWSPETPPIAPSAAPAPDWGLDWLPLETDLTPAQLREEAQAVLGKMASDLKVNDDANTAGSYSSRLVTQAAALAEAEAGNDEQAINEQWGILAGLIQDFDFYVQRMLAPGSETVICGYQLGRALADSYWALDPSRPKDPSRADDDPDPASWWFLFGQKRCTETERLLGRLAAYFHPYTAAAIAGSVEVWKSAVAGDDYAGYPTRAGRGMRRQIRRWYELIILKQDPTTLIRPYQLLRDWRLVWRGVGLFWFQLLLGGLAAAALALFAYLLTVPSVSSGITTLLGALGITGIPVAGLAAKLKNDAQAMLTRLKEDAYTDLIAVAITAAPPPPAPGETDTAVDPPPPTSARQAQLTRIVRQRRITPVTPG